MKLSNIFKNGKNNKLYQVINNSESRSYKSVERFLKANPAFLRGYETHMEIHGLPETSQNAIIWELIDMASDVNRTFYRSQKKVDAHEARMERLMDDDYGLPCYALQDHANPGYC